jgi:hypothetical protein
VLRSRNDKPLARKISDLVERPAQLGQAVLEADEPNRHASKRFHFGACTSQAMTHEASGVAICACGEVQA